ncbi:MAG: ATP-binding cassette domain-containing protein, partial [Vagococcus salmoninarum]|uniref:ATP-binding cassette domain-containing protein n=1 Tax=Vagococcus salmoninarum TaxID=2739 RepID=UPI003F9DE157
MTFKEGQIYGITGPNGSGKSMLLRSLLGIIRPTKGNLLINEKAVDFSEIYPLNTGILIDKPAFVPNFTAEKNLEMLRLLNNNIPKEEIASTLAEVQILNLQKRKVSE